MLKPDRREFKHDIEWYFGAVAERGGIASIAVGGTQPSGGYPGDPNSMAAYAANPSGQVPLGILLYDVVSFDTNRQHENWYKSGFQARAGMKVAIDRSGRYTTNMIPSGVSPQAGQPAYLGPSGLITNVQATGAPAAVGVWLGAVDQDGYAKIQLTLG
jgi:hypothetical protein